MAESSLRLWEPLMVSCPPRPALSQSTHLTLYLTHCLAFLYKIALFLPQGPCRHFFSFCHLSPPSVSWGPLPVASSLLLEILSAGLCREHELPVQHQRQPGFPGRMRRRNQWGVSRYFGAGCLRSLSSVCTHGRCGPPGSRACCRPPRHSPLLIC